LDVGEHGGFTVEFKFLRQVADTQSALDGEISRVRPFDTGEDFQQAGFATAVAPDQAYFFTFIDGECDAFEQSLISVGEGQFVG